MVFPNGNVLGADGFGPPAVCGGRRGETRRTATIEAATLAAGPKGTQRYRVTLTSSTAAPTRQVTSKWKRTNLTEATRRPSTIDCDGLEAVPWKALRDASYSVVVPDQFAASALARCESGATRIRWNGVPGLVPNMR